MNIALIPARGGSKSIPQKNIKPIAGKPLIYWAVKAASECGDINKVYVCTDCEAISSHVLQFKLPNVEVIGRTAESATDTASTESVMLEFSRSFMFENIALIQATSPLVTAEDLHEGFKQIAQDGVDSVISVVRQKRFIWSDTEKGYIEPANYDLSNRPRRQEFEGFLVENGAFYMTGRDALIQSGCRLSGNIKPVLMPDESYVELDELSDWLFVENILRQRSSTNGLFNIKMLITDCDGTLTDAGMYYSHRGEEMKKFNTRDAAGLRMLKEKGIITAIVTGESSEIVSARAQKMKIDELLMGIEDKPQAVLDLCAKYGVDACNVAYIGDDLNDYDAMRLCGFKACPADAVSEIREISDFVSIYPGGQGAVRDICEYVLRS